ncbi:MAG TPA: long-chain fatty acid--CoA ligase [bacterium]|jgi:fatty-acyl-CoA synthase
MNDERRTTNDERGLGTVWGIWHWLERRADINPDKPALLDGARSITYRQLAARVAGAARYLERYGLRKGDRIAILSINRAEYIETIFAAAWLGAIVVPLNWRLTPPELAFQVQDSEPKMLVVDPSLVSLVDGLKAQPESALIQTYFSFSDADRDALPWAIPYDVLVFGLEALPPGQGPEGDAEDPLLIMYTSGTTGRPKGAVLTQATQFWNSINIGTAIGLTDRDVTLNVLPMFHAGGIGLYTLPSIHHGATAVIQRAFDPEQTVQLIAAHEVTAMLAVPAMYLALLQSKAFVDADLGGMRFASGGAPCPVTIIDAFERRGVLFQQGYGLTETSPTCTLIPAADAFRKKGSVGKATLHAELRVVDDAGQDVPPGGIGEVWTRGPNLFSGYWRRPAATAEVMVSDPAGESWFRTGDLARIDAEGFLYIVDRKTDMIISGGENIYPAEVEDVLFRHPAVLEAAVFGIPDERWGEAAQAAVVVKPGQSLSLDELRRFCDGQLARYKIPKGLQIVDALPRNAAGKVLKRMLREQFGRHAVREH